MRRSLLSTLIVCLATSCRHSVATDPPKRDAALAADAIPWQPDAIVALLVSTSWVDRGDKAIILDTRAAYACRQGTCRSFKVTEGERAELLRSYSDHAFADLRDMHAQVTDGSEARLSIADETRAYAVADYMTPNRDFDAIHEQFARVVASHFDEGEEITRAAIHEALTRSSAAWRGDPRGREVETWLGIAVGDPSADAPPVGTVEVGAITATVEVLNVAAVVRWLQGKGFRACYDAGLKAEPAMAGRVKLSVRISSDGSVRSAHGEGITGMSDAVVQCLMGKVRHAQFAPPGEMGSTLTIPLTFSQHTAPR